MAMTDGTEVLRQRERRLRHIAGLAIGLWTALYLWRTLVGHLSLNTNAYDLSVFDYALWSLTRGERGVVPFIGHSIFSHHFMPILAVLAPVYALFQSSAALVVLQILVVAASALTYVAFQRRLGVNPRLTVLLTIIFLFARRTHGAATAVFYPECFQTLLSFCLVLAMRGAAWRFWTIAALLLSTKEDAAIYVAVFASVQWYLGNERSRSIKLVLISIAWCLLAFVVAIPAARRADGLPPTNPLLEARYGTASGALDAGQLAGRLVSASTLDTLQNLAVTTAGLPAIGISWFLPALPSVAINLMAPPGTGQAALTQHYAWPLLPWLFMAVAAGTVRVDRWRPMVAMIWVVVLLVVTLVDNPALQRVFRTRLDPEAGIVRRQLHEVRGQVILAQPNLIPHLPHRSTIFSLGSKEQPSSAPDCVLITRIGNLWPFTPQEIDAMIAKYSQDPLYTTIGSGPLYVFVLRR